MSDFNEVIERLTRSAKSGGREQLAPILASVVTNDEVKGFNGAVHAKIEELNKGISARIGYSLGTDNSHNVDKLLEELRVLQDLPGEVQKTKESFEKQHKAFTKDVLSSPCFRE